MKVALVIGHKSSSGGARGQDGTTEYTYNRELVYKVASFLLEHTSVSTKIVYRTEYKDLPDQINKDSPDLIVSFHCNAYNGMVSGTEVLYYNKSSKGQHIASVLQVAMLGALGLRDRGIKGKGAEDRGGYLLRYTKAPCVLLESFFIDNPSDLAIGVHRKEFLAKVIAEAIARLGDTG